MSTNLVSKSFSKAQLAFISRNTRFILWRASRRQGKTEAAEYKLAKYALTHKEHICWFVAQDLALCNERNIPLFRDLMPEGSIVAYSKSERCFTLFNGTKAYFKTANSSDSLRGRKVHFLICEEPPYWQNGGDIFHNILRPQLADTGGICIIIFTPPTLKAPKGAEWVRRLEGIWAEEIKNGNPDYALFHNNVWDSPFIADEEKKNLERQTDPETWSCEWLANYNDKQGQVYWEFDPLIKKIELDITEPILARVRGLDWGISDNTACSWVELLNDNRVYIRDAYEANNMDVPSQANAIKARTQYQPIWSVLDSACWARDVTLSSVARRFQAEGIPVVPATKDLDGSVSDMKRMFSNGKILINPKCTCLLQAIQDWQHGQHEPDILAATRYAIDGLIRGGKLLPPIRLAKEDHRNALEKFDEMAKQQSQINSKLERRNSGNAFRFI